MKQTRKLKRKVPVFRVHIMPGASYDQLTEIPEIKEVVIEELVIAIKEAVSTKKKSINLFEIADSNYYIKLDKSEFKRSLETALEYFIEKEDYDKCIECRELIKEL
jgi:hypothetical protein